MHLVPLLCHGRQCSSKLHRDASHHVDPVIVTVSAMNTGILLCMMGFILAITVTMLDKVGMKQLGLDGVIQQESKKVTPYHGKRGARSDHFGNLEHIKHYAHYPAVYAAPEPGKAKLGE
ncbi:unnamed protein product [Eretmochelys imbricata]